MDLVLKPEVLLKPVTGYTRGYLELSITPVEEMY